MGCDIQRQTQCCVTVEAIKLRSHGKNWHQGETLEAASGLAGTKKVREDEVKGSETIECYVVGMQMSLEL